MLTADNPHAPTNVVRYSFKENSFKPVSAIDQLAIHFAMDSNLLHKESDEAVRQQAKLEGDGEREGGGRRREAGRESETNEQKCTSSFGHEDWARRPHK